MKRKRFKPKMLTFTLVSNEANKRIKRFYFPRFIVSFIGICALIPIILLIYHVTMNNTLLTANEELVDQLSHLNQKKESLAAEISVLESERDIVIERFEELNEIEEQINHYITELPHEALGGIDIPLNEDDIAYLSNDEIDQFILTTDWIESYQTTLANMEQLGENLQYIPTAWPTEPNTITSPFGPRNDPFNQTQSMHSGIDVRGATGTPIYAAADGVVTLASSFGGYGKTIKIDHGGRYETLYAHLSEIDVNVGDRVKKTEEIGAIGSTGRSTGPHLHYEIIKDGVPVDPEYYLNFFTREDN